MLKHINKSAFSWSISGQIFRTFYTYDAVNINQSRVVNNTVIILHPKKSEFVFKTTAIMSRESSTVRCKRMYIMYISVPRKALFPWDNNVANEVSYGKLGRSRDILNKQWLFQW